MLRINSLSPDFEANSTHGTIKFHDYINNSWAILFSHPKDFTPVCTTELGYMGQIQKEFEKAELNEYFMAIAWVLIHGG